jgi:hypothetical protein
VPRLGTDENAKITAAQRTTGSHVATGDRRTDAASVDTAEW